VTIVAVVDAARTVAWQLLGTFGQSALEGAAVGGLVWLICRALPGLPAAVRAWLWWLVALKLVLGVLPVPALLPIPLLPTTEVAPAPADTMLVLPTSGMAADPVTAPISIPYASLWPVALVGLWTVAMLWQAAGLAGALRAARRLRRDAEPAPAVIARRVGRLVQQFALTVLPDVLTSRRSSAPVITGVLKPTILLPTKVTAAMPREQLDLLLGHELAHVRRGDLVWGWVPAIATRLFFFHPIAHLATREYLAAREEACDAEVLQTLGASPAQYGQLLLALGVAPSHDVLAAAGSSRTYTSLKRRLTMLDRSSTPASRWWWVLAGATALSVPLTLVARPAAQALPEPMPAAFPSAAIAPATVPAAEGQDTSRYVVYPDGEQRTMPPPPPPPPPPPADAVSPAPADAPPPPPPPPPPPAAAAAAHPAAPAAPAAPPAPPAPPEWQDDEPRNRAPWVLLEGNDRNKMSGSSSDRAAAERNRTNGETLLWFRHQGTAYVTRDPKTIAALRQAFAPVEVLGQKMGELGSKQGAIGGEQGHLGAQQGQLGAQQAALGADIARITAERLAITAQRMQSKEGARSTAEEDKVRDLERQQKDVEAKMRALGDEQRKLGEQMRALGDKMRVEGDGMRELGQKMKAEVAAAEDRAAQVFGAAVASGSATRAR